MKAILVIDMPDNLKNHLDKVKVDVIGTLNGQELFHRLNQPLKLMLDKYDLNKHPVDLIHGVNEWYAHDCGYVHGWNACLEKLEK